jgi:hypothetical protein
MVTWTISTLERELSDGGVIVAHWRATDSETVGEGDDAVTYSASSYGTCGFSPDPSSPDWVAYDSLTEADCLQWCWDNGVDKDATEASLAAKIEADKNPTQGSGVPW